jgi:hypothetical protein
MAEVRPEQLDPHSAGRVLAVLNAGATIHAVEYDEARQRYLVRSELFEFLSVVAKRAFEASDHHVNLAELEKIVVVSLLPDLSQNADTVLHYIHPISEDRGFTGEIKFDEVVPEHIRVVRSTLNAGATLNRVKRAGKDATHYFVHRDFYRTLAVIRARTLMSDYGQKQIESAAPEQTFGGALNEPSKAIEHKRDDDGEAEPAASRIDALDEMAAERRFQYLVDLLDALQLDPTTYEQCSGPAFSAAVAANEALSRARRSNQLLDKALAARDEQAHRSLDEAFSLSKGKLRPDQDRERQLLRDAYQEIAKYWHVLMLFPNGPYEDVLRVLVEELETDAGAGTLSTDDAALYGIARTLVDAFKGNGRGNEFSWRRLEGGFNQALHGSHTPVAFSDDKRTIN